MMQQLFRLLCLGACAWPLAFAARGQQVNVVPPPPGISFSTLPGPNGALYLGHTEGDFNVTPTAGNWYQAMVYGNAPPSIFDGPVDAPSIAVLQVTDNVNVFHFNSLSYSSNNGESSYDIQGFLGATLQYHQSGTLNASFSPFTFNTLLSDYSSLPVDALLFEVIPGVGTTSVNIDNIGVVTVPEPAAGLACLAGLAGFCALRRRQRG